MARLLLLLLLPSILACDLARAQFNPNAYVHLAVGANDPKKKNELAVASILDRELMGLFKNLQPIEVIAIEITDPKNATISSKNDWKKRIEEALQQAGVKLQRQPTEGSPKLLAKVLVDPQTKNWTATLEISERVFLNRPKYPKLNCVTYRDKHSNLPSRQVAHRELFECVEVFCWLYSESCTK